MGLDYEEVTPIFEEVTLIFLLRSEEWVEDRRGPRSASKTTVLHYSSEAETFENLCKPMENTMGV